MKMTWHEDKNRLVCHHCDARRKLPARCPDCNESELMEVGHGTQRLDRTLAEHFPQARILRIDRDSTRRKGSMEKMIRQITSGDADILIGTQMLAKGHHFPRLTLVGTHRCGRRSSEHQFPRHGAHGPTYRPGKRQGRTGGQARRCIHPDPFPPAIRCCRRW